MPTFTAVPTQSPGDEWTAADQNTYVRDNLQAHQDALQDSALLAAIKNVDGSGSGLDADTVDGAEPSISSSANTIAQRDANGDISTSAGKALASSKAGGFIQIKQGSVTVPAGSAAADYTVSVTWDTPFSDIYGVVTDISIQYETTNTHKELVFSTTGASKTINIFRISSSIVVTVTFMAFGAI